MNNPLAQRLAALTVVGLRRRWVMAELLGAPPSARWRQTGVRAAGAALPRPKHGRPAQVLDAKSEVGREPQEE